MSLFADGNGAAMLHTSTRGVLLNKNAAPASTALFANDLIETPKNVAALISAPGSSVQVNSETMVQFQADELVLDHGSLSIFTVRGLRVRIGCVTVTPVNSSVETLYEVTDLDGKVTVHASKSDVYVDGRSKDLRDVKKSSKSEREIVHEGEQKSREERCAVAPVKGQSTPGIGPILNSPFAKIAATGVVLGLTCWALCTTDNPASPAKP